MPVTSAVSSAAADAHRCLMQDLRSMLSILLSPAECLALRWCETFASEAVDSSGAPNRADR